MTLSDASCTYLQVFNDDLLQSFMHLSALPRLHVLCHSYSNERLKELTPGEARTWRLLFQKAKEKEFFAL